MAAPVFNQSILTQSLQSITTGVTGTVEQVRLVAENAGNVAGVLQQILHRLDAIDGRLDAMDDRFDELSDKFVITESRNLARVYNASAFRSESVLHPLVNDDNDVPASFPATRTAFEALTPAQVTTLLAFYGLNVAGLGPQEKKTRLRGYFGIAQ